MTKKMVYCTQCGHLMEDGDLFCSKCGSKKPSRAKDNIMEIFDEKSIIEHYFYKFYTYDDIVKLLEIHHQIRMSTRTLERKLQSYGLQKRRNNVTEDQLRQLIEREIQGPGSLRGH